MASNNSNNVEDSAVERMDEGHPNDVVNVDLDASDIIAMGTPGGSRPSPSQVADGASLPPDALELPAQEPLGPEVERLIEEVLEPELTHESVVLFHPHGAMLWKVNVAPSRGN